MKPVIVFILSSTFILFSSCQNIDIELEKQNIQALMDSVYQAHFEKDAQKFYAPNDSVWWDIRNGNIRKSNKRNTIPATQNYLDNMDFLELKNSHDPIIEISKDGFMASYVGAIHLKGKLNKQPVFWVVAWQSVLVKKNGTWKIIQTANTELAENKMASVILKNSKTALGTEEKLFSIENISSLADCNIEDSKFFTLIFSGKNQTRFEQKSDRGTTILAKDDSTSFQWNSQTNELKKDLDVMTQQFIHGHELHWLSLFPEHRFYQPIFKEYTQYPERDAFKIEFKDDLERPVWFYYDFENDLPLGFEMYTGTMEESETVLVYFKKWEEQEGVQVFKNAVFQQGDYIFNYDFENVKFNTLKEDDFLEQKMQIVK